MNVIEPIAQGREHQTKTMLAVQQRYQLHFRAGQDCDPPHEAQPLDACRQDERADVRNVTGERVINGAALSGLLQSDPLVRLAAGPCPTSRTRSWSETASAVARLIAVVVFQARPSGWRRR